MRTARPRRAAPRTGRGRRYAHRERTSACRLRRRCSWLLVSGCPALIGPIGVEHPRRIRLQPSPPVELRRPLQTFPPARSAAVSNGSLTQLAVPTRRSRRGVHVRPSTRCPSPRSRSCVSLLALRGTRVCDLSVAAARAWRRPATATAAARADHPARRSWARAGGGPRAAPNGAAALPPRNARSACPIQRYLASKVLDHSGWWSSCRPHCSRSSRLLGPQRSRRPLVLSCGTRTDPVRGRLPSPWPASSPGLLISAAIDNADRGMPLLVLLIMVQLIFCGGLFEVYDPPGARPARLARSRTLGVLHGGGDDRSRRRRP